MNYYAPTSIRIHLGCGSLYRDGWVNIDTSPHVRADLNHDLNCLPWPFDGGSVDEIFADQLLEHLDDTPAVMQEVLRILKPGGVFHGQVPYCGSVWAFQDPTHKVFFSERSFVYYDRNRPAGTPRLGQLEFSKVEAKLVCNSNSALIRIRNLIPFKKLLRWFLWNMYDGVYFRLTK